MEDTQTWQKRKQKKKAAKKSGNKDVLVVASKVKAYIRSKKMMCSSDAIGSISDGIYDSLDRAIERAKANRRSTVKPQDI